jgi:N-acetylmuramoyl-L-alanine amidase
MALAMSSAGFGTYALGYSDESYAEVAPGVFVDRHPKGKRIRMLRGTGVPTIIVETHQAFDPDEAERWTESATLDAFAAAVRAAVVATTRPE